MQKKSNTTPHCAKHNDIASIHFCTNCKRYLCNKCFDAHELIFEKEHNVEIFDTDSGAFTHTNNTQKLKADATIAVTDSNAVSPLGLPSLGQDEDKPWLPPEKMQKVEKSPGETLKQAVDVLATNATDSAVAGEAWKTLQDMSDEVILSCSHTHEHAHAFTVFFLFHTYHFPPLSPPFFKPSKSLQRLKEKT